MGSVGADPLPWSGREERMWHVDKSPVSREYIIKKKGDIHKETIHQRVEKAQITEMTSPPKSLAEANFNKQIIRKVLDTLKGYHVVARDDEDGHYYPGIVVKCTDARHALVEFFNKERKVIPTRMIIASSGAVPRPLLRMGDCVLVQVMNPQKQAQSYVPGIIQVPPRCNEIQAKFYTVLMYNGQQATAMRSSLLKISKARFEFAIKYIAEVQHQDHETLEKNVYVTPRDEKRDERRNDRRDDRRDDSRSHKKRKEKPKRRPSSSLNLSDDNEIDRPDNPTPTSGGRAINIPSQTPESPLDSPKAPISSVRSSPSNGRHSRSSSRSRSRSSTPRRSRSRSSSSRRSRSRSSSPRRSRSRSSSPKQRRSRSSTPVRRRSRSPSATSVQSSERARTPPRRSRTNSETSRRTGSRSPSESGSQRRSSKDRGKKKSKKVKDLKKKLKNQQKQHEEQQEELRQMYSKKLKKMKKKLKRKSRRGNEVVVEVESSSSDESKSKKAESVDLAKNFKEDSVLLQLRRSLPKLRKGEEVLARWSDEGWYFRGTVKDDCRDFSYIIEDSTRMCDQIFREDIITDYDDQDQVIQPMDSVVALHPNYNFSYAPGKVLEVSEQYSQLHITVKFYDGQQDQLPRDEVYKICLEKYDSDVNYIVKCETQWIGNPVVARDDETGLYYFASVKERIGNGREYVLEWCHRKPSTCQSINMFGSFTKDHPLVVGDYVLALADSSQNIFLPGQVAGIVGDKINIKFCDDTLQDIDNEPHKCNYFWLSSRYYDYAVDYWQESNAESQVQ